MSHLMTKPTKWHVRPAKTQISFGAQSFCWFCLKVAQICTHWSTVKVSGVTIRQQNTVNTNKLIICDNRSYELMIDYENPTDSHHYKTLIRLGRCPGWSEPLLGAWVILLALSCSFEPPHDKTNKMACAPSENRSVWASAQSDQSLLSAWRKLGSLATCWVHSEDSDQTGQMPRLIWVFAGRTVFLLVLSWGGSFVLFSFLRGWRFEGSNLPMQATVHANGLGINVERRNICPSYLSAFWNSIEYVWVSEIIPEYMPYIFTVYCAFFSQGKLDMYFKSETVCQSYVVVSLHFGPRQANLVLIAYASSEGSGAPAHLRSLARTSAARSYKQWVKRNLQIESQIPGPSEWLGMRS